MSDAQLERMKAWVANWKVTGEELDRIKWEELRNMDPSEALEQSTKSLAMADEWRMAQVIPLSRLRYGRTATFCLCDSQTPRNRLGRRVYGNATAHPAIRSFATNARIADAAIRHCRPSMGCHPAPERTCRLYCSRWQHPGPARGLVGQEDRDAID